MQHARVTSEGAEVHSDGLSVTVTLCVQHCSSELCQSFQLLTERQQGRQTQSDKRFSLKGRTSQGLGGHPELTLSTAAEGRTAAHLQEEVRSL